MKRISDALELLTAQHDEIEELLGVVTSSTDPAVRSVAFGELADKLTAHLAIEQELLYPEVSTIVTGPVMREVMSEHTEIKRILADLLWLDLDDARFDVKLATLRTMLDGHAAWQEDQLFTTVAETVPDDQLARLGSRLHVWFDASLCVAEAA